MKPAKLAPVFTALILTACHSPPSPPPRAIAVPPSIGSGQGIDLPTDASDVLIELQQRPVEFVARYYREPQSRWPPLSASEAQQLSSLGLKIVAVWELHSRDPAHFSYTSGYFDAMTAYDEARAIGQPAGSAIYFAVDFNARGQLLDDIDAYFRGIAAGLAMASGGRATYAVGVYGSGVVCDAIKRAGLARYSWLSNSFAWEGSTSYDDWDIMQGAPSPDLSFNQDSDEARADYGAFRIAGGAPAASSDPAGLGAPVSPQSPPPQFRTRRAIADILGQRLLAETSGQLSHRPPPRSNRRARLRDLNNRGVAGRGCHSPTRVKHLPQREDAEESHGCRHDDGVRQLWLGQHRRRSGVGRGDPAGAAGRRVRASTCCGRPSIISSIIRSAPTICS